jgi:hypothetical protein
MEGTIYCLVDASGTVHVTDGAESYSEAAAAGGLDENACQTYRFDLINRRLLTDRGTPAGDRAAHTYVDRCVGTPERLVQFAAEGHLSKAVLMNLVPPDKRKAFVDACAVVEKTYTDDCAAKNDPCLESGCAVEDEICLQPLLRAGIEYQKSCAAEWIKLFADPRNRIDAWKN